MRLTDTERIHILIMRGCGDKMRSYEEVANLFNNKFPTRDPISKSTVHRTVLRFERTGLVTLNKDPVDQRQLLMMMCAGSTKYY